MGLLSVLKHLDAQKCGLHVITDTEREQMKKIYVEMLDQLDDICSKNNIEWGLTGGSAIGAVRHKGFIPWDDDVDIVMTRENFEKLQNIFKKNDFGNYELLVAGDQGYYSIIPKIFDESTLLKLIQPTGKGTGLFIDIFVLDNTYNNKLLRYLHGIQCTMYLFIVSTMVTHVQKDVLNSYGSKELKRQVLIRDLFSLFFQFRHVEKWLPKATKCFSKVKDNKSEYVVSVTGGKHYFGELYLREEMCNFERMEFEGHMFPVMKGYDYFLSQRYGKDYMTIPPKEKWERHACVEFNLNRE